ncbi:MAG: hypothetical protein FJ116_06975 [Deltaproteobacteria bacterium]|nr:hypothetical protein [Deltaproteobacteria bacterium]
MMKLLFLLALVGGNLMASVAPSMTIPRDASRRYLTDGVFEGGKPIKANLEALRFFNHKQKGFERWVFDFSDATTQTVGSVAPKFQVRYQKASKVENQGQLLTLEPARIIISIKGVIKNQISRSQLEKLPQRSTLVKEVIVYPPIDEGDIAIEMLLKDSYPFYTHQPLNNEGRLVIDLSTQG